MVRLGKGPGMKKKNLRRVSSIRRLYPLVFLLLIFSLACSLIGGAATIAPPAGEGTAAAVERSAGGAAAATAATAAPPPAPTPVLEGPAKIGQPFLICDTAVTVIGWENVQPGLLFEPEARNRFVAVEIVMVNLGPVPVDIVQFTFELLDSYDEKLPIGVFPIMYAHSASLMGGLAPGERIRGKAGFEVPEEEQDFSLETRCYNFDTEKTGKLTVDLGSKPRSVEAPGIFEGEIRRDPLALGETARVNTVKIAPKEVLPFPKRLVDPDDPRVPTPPDWQEYIIVEMALENIGMENVELYVLTDLYVEDPEGRRWKSADWVSYVLEDPIDTMFTMAPGEKVNGQLAFQVPRESTHWILVFECGYGAEGAKAYFLLR
jgi:hypothetical protein